MERLNIYRPRASHRQWMPMSAMLTLGVHWHQKTWLCGGEGCGLCSLVPRREVAYFAALTKHGQGERQMYLVERSTAVVAEALRLSALNWPEALGKLVVIESTEGRRIAVTGTYTFEDRQGADIPVSQLAFSVARLFQMPHFPECSTVGEARRFAEAYSRRLQKLHSLEATEVL